MIKLSITCGCKFATSDLREALTHAEDTGHLMAVSGTVRCEADPLAVRAFNRAKESIVQGRVNDLMWDQYDSNKDAIQDRIPDAVRPGRRP